MNDPAAFPTPTSLTGMNLSDKEFDRIVRRALESIPDEIMHHVTNVAITVEDRPSPELLEDMGLPPDEPLFGVYTGVALPDRSVSAPDFFPDSIILFREPLLEICETIGELEEEIAITVVHEIAHYFGISEERLTELGYG
ncbi:MAG TPA: metallopeptidase family protein [Deltaproteobacteria bacterium]|nr:metallopeptidase family protein [Deltaproteobacteria bacterium]HRW79785.1 metallopeptidase family protein [Desulfomonilia bacterium]HOA43814.1 metallopeptidase family protein [Deltaproteobacteria bacterium]HOC76036.1 metallopeptidase family protein [Deltaproteobacteria bacterium]HOG83282.1 metallopeptidase family protein [Deltaproteobacteria bacterium]